ncbi:MAG: glycosyltransferase [Pseudomonadota bacterium]
MKISVALVTYNHRPFLKEALDSVLQQSFDDDWEVVIGDDASTDGTSELIAEYQRQYPQRVRVLSRDANAADGGRSNAMATLRACRGDYIAYLDGDDYWLGNHKLAAQAAMLDASPALSACVHPVIRDYGDGRQDHFGAPARRAPFSQAEIARNFTFVHCSAFMYRRAALPVLPDWFADARIVLDDWTLALLCARQGDIGYLDEVLGVYRKHAQGIWSGQDTLGRLYQELETRAFVHTKLIQSVQAEDARSARFRRDLQRAQNALARGAYRRARLSLSRALANFPFPGRLSNTYRLMFLIEAWAAFSKPLLLGLRRWWR